MIPEREREALEHLTMCAREECVMCKYQGDCNFDFQYELATKNMNILAEALRKLNNSEKPNNFDKDINVRSKDEPTTQTETQNSNLTFEKDECAKEYEELGLKELKELIKADRKTENCSEKPNNCEDEARIITDGTYLYTYDKMLGEWRPIQDISGHKQTERSSE